MGLFSIFARKPAPPRNLEDLIYDIAEHMRDADFLELYERMRNREVFVPLVQSSLPANVRAGQTVTSATEHPLVMRTISGPNGQVLIPCATLQSAQVLREGYAGMRWEAFLEMMLKSGTEIFGVLLQGQRSWVAFDRQRVRHILERAPPS